MPAPRTCRSCGAPLETRRCPRCGIEVSEFAAREVLHRDGFVGTPSHVMAGRGHYSRWEASPTTFGPAVRVGGTVFLLGTLAIGFFLTFFILWFVQLFLTGWLLKELWRPGWIVPSPESSPRTDEHRVEVITDGFRVPPPPERVEPVPALPRTRGEIAGLVLLAIAGVALLVVLTFGSNEMRAGAIMLTTLLGMYAFFRSFLNR